MYVLMTMLHHYFALKIFCCIVNTDIPSDIVGSNENETSLFRPLIVLAYHALNFHGQS